MNRLAKPFPVDPNVAAVASLIGDPARASMLLALLGGGELPASQLASRAGALRSSASAHLSKLVAGGLLSVTRSGRQRLFRIASPEVGQALEALGGIARPARISALSQNYVMRHMREARTCYDHLAGRLGVAFAEALVEGEAIGLNGREFTLLDEGEHVLRELGIDLNTLHRSKRKFAPACLDWTERRPHIAGSLGAAVLNRFVAAGWVARTSQTRALQITVKGREQLERLHVRLA